MDICRLCMEASNLNQSMADETILVMVEDCIQIKLDIPNELLPLDICDDCYYKVKDFSEFKENCHAIQEMLQQEIEENRREQDESSNSGFSLFGDEIQYSDYIDDSLLFGDISTDDLLSDLQNSCNSNCSADLDIIANEFFNDSNNNNDNIHNINNDQHQEQEKDKTDAEVTETKTNIENKKRTSKRCYRNEYTAALLTCEICGKMIHKTLLPGHLNMHKGIKPYVCPKEGCKSTFHCKHKLKRHLGYKHTDGNFPCKKCDKVFNSNLALYHHTFASHQLRDKVCNECEKTFRTSHGLNRHMQTHSQERKLKCTYCPKTFVRNSVRNSHIQTHTKERPYVCAKCNANYSYRRLLVNHIKRKHPDSEAILQTIECTRVSVPVSGTAPVLALLH